MRPFGSFILLASLLLIGFSLVGIMLNIFSKNGDCQFDSGRYFIREIEEASKTNFSCNCYFQGDKFYPIMLDRYGRHNKDEMLSKFINGSFNLSSSVPSDKISINLSNTVPRNYGRID
jgi:hypothetical protein